MPALHFIAVVTSAALAGLGGIGPPGADRDLTFQQRVEAQRAIERAYYSHQIGAARPFDEAVPPELIEEKVRGYLKGSVALERIWGVRMTSGMLRAEAQRMARGTRMPERLRELQQALGDDPFLIDECLVRPALVDRLARGYFAFDGRIHAEARREAEAQREALLSGRIDVARRDPRRQVVHLARPPADPRPDPARSSAGPRTAAPGK